MTDLVTLCERLAEAERARHKLMIGTATASVQYEGKGQVTYTKADLDKLDSYIGELRRRIAAATGCDRSSRLQPINFTF